MNVHGGSWARGPALALVLLAGCGPEADSDSIQDCTPGSCPGTAGSGDAPPGSNGEGLSCSYLLGQVSLTSYVSPASYASSSFNFALASQDADVTGNRFDLLHEDGDFVVNTVVGDASFIVDLGASVALVDVPDTVDPGAYPTGEFGEHDAVQADLDHAYFVRTVRADGKGVAAFRVIGLEPGGLVTIDWARSVDPDRMVFPAWCGD